MSFIEQQCCVDESEYAVLVSVERKQLNLGFGAAVQRNRAEAGGCLLALRMLPYYSGGFGSVHSGVAIITKISSWVYGPS